MQSNNNFSDNTGFFWYCFCIYSLLLLRLFMFQNYSQHESVSAASA